MKRMHGAEWRAVREIESASANRLLCAPRRTNRETADGIGAGATSENNPFGHRSLSLACSPRLRPSVTALAELRKRLCHQDFALRVILASLGLPKWERSPIIAPRISMERCEFSALQHWVLGMARHDMQLNQNPSLVLNAFRCFRVLLRR